VRRWLKALHEIAAIGVAGTLAACIVLVATAPEDSPVAYAAVRGAIAALVKWLLVPSLALVLVSGLLAIAFNRAYHDAGWAWLKALTGITIFEGTLLTIAASTRRAAEMSAAAVSGAPPAPGQLEAVLRTEWGGLWMILAVALANVALAIWRPRLWPRGRASGADGSPRD
jgi:hypothetical protein